MPKCPKCKSDKRVKNGFMKGLQRYRCKTCGCNFTKSESGKVPAKFKRDVIRLYLLGMSMCKIAKFLGVSDVSVLHWIRAAGYEALQDIHNHAQVSQDFEIIEIDEMWHYLKKRNSQFGYGYVLTELPTNQSPLLSVNVIKAH